MCLTAAGTLPGQLAPGATVADSGLPAPGDGTPAIAEVMAEVKAEPEPEPVPVWEPPGACGRVFTAQQDLAEAKPGLTMFWAFMSKSFCEFKHCRQHVVPYCILAAPSFELNTAERSQSLTLNRFEVYDPV